MTWQADAVLAFLTTLLFIPHVRISGRYFLVYMIVPLLLVWSHVVGQILQETNTGPEWIQNHFHNMGVAGGGIAISNVVVGYLGYHGKLGGVEGRIRAVRAMSEAVFGLFVITTFTCVAYEVMLVIFRKEELISQGYSGELDTVDMLAYGVGLLLMLANYLFVRPWALRATAKLTIQAA